MKTRILSLALALAVCLGLMVPAEAATRGGAVTVYGMTISDYYVTDIYPYPAYEDYGEPSPEREYEYYLGEIPYGDGLWSFLLPMDATVTFRGRVGRDGGGTPLPRGRTGYPSKTSRWDVFETAKNCAVWTPLFPKMQTGPLGSPFLRSLWLYGCCHSWTETSSRRGLAGSVSSARTKQNWLAATSLPSWSQ